MLFGLFGKKEVDPVEYFRHTKKIHINGVRFMIKKINIDDHLTGLNVILKMRDLYKREKPTDPAEIMQDQAKLKKFMRDFIYAGVVSPKLSIKEKGEPAPGVIHVDDILDDMDFSNQLCVQIIEYAYGKKKLNA